MPASTDRMLIDRIQQANDIVDVVSEHVRLNKKGREMVGLCPFHDDHRPSLYVNPVKQIFKCFACGAGGDAFKFVQMRENLTFGQAIERLAQRAGINIPRGQGRAEKGKTKTADIDPNELAKINAWALKHFQSNLAHQVKGKAARDYLAERKIKSDDIKKWQLGLAGDSGDELLKAAGSAGISEKILIGSGLVVGEGEPLRDKFINRLMFPIPDVTGRVIGFGGRTLTGSGAKYINSPTTALFDKSNALYGLQQARDGIVSNDLAVVVEGYTDCIMAHSKGISNVVACMGTSLTTGQAKILRRYAKKVVLVFDSDTAGMEAANRALEIFLAQQIDIKLAFVPEGKDPCEFLLAAGKEKFEQLINQAVDVFQYKWDRLTNALGAQDTLRGKRTAIVEYLETVASAVRSGTLAALDRGLLLNRLAGIVGVEPKQLNRQLTQIITRNSRSQMPRQSGTTGISGEPGEGLFASAQREVLEVLLNRPSFFETVKAQITVDDFGVAILNQTAAIVFETLESEPLASLNQILTGAETVELGNQIVLLAEQGEAKGNFSSRLEAALQVMQRHINSRRKDKLKAAGDTAAFLREVHKDARRQNPHNVGMT